MIICLFNAKGGVSKSTCSVHLTYYLAKICNKKTALIDADPMRISSFWLNELDLDLPIFQLTDPDNFLEEISEISSKYKYTIVDCPANASEMNRAIIFALGEKDKLLIPVKPTSVDKIASNPTLRLIKQATIHGKKFKAATFVSMAHRSRAVTEETLEYLKGKEKDTGVKALDSIIYDKASIADALDQGGIVWSMGNRAASEQKEFTAWCEEVIKL
jgi:chromosome partitioning protein